jgi:hypothetical protein
MLRWSSEHMGYDLDIRSIGDPALACGVPGGNALLGLVDALLADGDADAARARVRAELGDAGLMHAAGVFGNFQMMNRIAEGTGIPIPRQRIDAEADAIEAIGLDHMVKSQHV